MRNAYVRVFAFPEFTDHLPFQATIFRRGVRAPAQWSWSNPNAVPWGIGAPERIKVAKRKLKTFIAAGGREQIVAGTDAGSPFNVHSPLTRELQHYLEAGLTSYGSDTERNITSGTDCKAWKNDLGTVTEGKLCRHDNC